MSTRKLNILIYAGPGVTPTSVRHATWTLRRLLGSNYAILTISAAQLLNEPWPPTCALLVIPGGADLAYCNALNGPGNRRIKQYVQGGGAYLGFCAGGYYGCARCEFEVGRREMEVVGERELAFFPGTCRGLAFGGFVYRSEAGARAVKLKGGEGRSFGSYYNGGGVFVDAEKMVEKGVEVLAEYEGEVAVEGGRAAVLFVKVGEGRVVLTGPHPEFAPEYLNPENYNRPDNKKIIEELKADERPRTEFVRSTLRRLGLTVNEDITPVPSLSRLHLSSIQPNYISELVQSLHEAGVVMKNEDGQEVIKGENDTFHLEEVGRWNMSSVTKAVTEALPAAVKDALPSTITSASTSRKPRADSWSADRLPDYNAAVKDLVAHESGLPDGKETPHFNHQAFFSNLCSQTTWGRTLLYGEVVTSTNTMLEKNISLLSHLPAGFVATATTQIAGRGRGTNVWVSPYGSLMFSVVIRHALTLSTSAPVVFIQYLAALAIIAGIKAYGKGYEKLPVRLKWPNDIYALDPMKSKHEYTKIGGILVNSSYSGGDYTLVVGVGINTNNSAPSVSLSQLATRAGLPTFTLEKLLACILTQFEIIYARFCRTGFDAALEKEYYASWLHSDQIVTLEAEGGVQARIKGITTDWGLLVAEELNYEGRPTGRRWELQSDSNSFDFFKGLVKKKV